LINHYVNLVVWKEICLEYDSGRDRIWIDSISLRFMIKLFGGSCNFRPGVAALSYRYNKEFENFENCFFLLAKPQENILSANSFVLPFFNEVSVNKNLEDIIIEIKPKSNVLIGISSPKQNLLAFKLYEIRPDLEYYCSGAALSANYLLNPKERESKFIKFGFEWFKFLLIDPSRTIKKLKTTIIEILRITFDMKYRFQFKQFVKICTDSDSAFSSYSIRS
jgi:hypothetical protein